MRDNLGGAIWRLAIFLTVCGFGTFALMAVFAQLRFDKETEYRALFSNVSGLVTGDFVRVAGVEVGKVKDIKLNPDSSVLVTFGTEGGVVLTEGSRAVVRYRDLIGHRYLALEEGAGGTKKLNEGDTIPISNTQPALDLDALIGGFRPLFRALDPEQVNQLSSAFITALQGQGNTIGGFLNTTASLTNTLADRDQLIGEVINNLNVTLKSFGDQTKQFDKTVDSLSQIVGALASRKDEVANSIKYTNDSAGTVADLLQQARPGIKKVVDEGGRATALIMADKDYLDNLINNLPEKYQTLNRLGLYGDFFTFYLCDAFLKVNGKGGNPIYIKAAGQDTGRCAPK
jgi:phospholipid/cholesterol/gamma-HCH transport system substrate-binding protein